MRESDRAFRKREVYQFARTHTTHARSGRSFVLTRRKQEINLDRRKEFDTSRPAHARDGARVRLKCLLLLKQQRIDTQQSIVVFVVETTGYIFELLIRYLNYDPFAGSPTKTLLRLLLPLSAPVRASFQRSP